MKMLLIVLHYHLTRNLFKICAVASVVDFGVTNTEKPVFKFYAILCIRFLLYMCFHTKNPLC